MARRFAQVDISRTQVSSVFIAFDDESEEFKDLLEDGKLTWKGLRKLREAATAAAEDINEYDWDSEESEIEIEGGNLIEEAEARQYECWDAAAKSTLLD